ncbi:MULTISPECIES: SDR family NAD(P)-dependent oxidoreductase [unclassified Sphingomonas]|uniref:SDR family NAD(P)-dependent oxidoreductase n=1 Tax=unclassified Sphingomonas TaxID=196159 RepID=UPI0006F881EA|nr:MULTISPECIES: SDR family NAD(P)-dependent oxidoreductase [unclassified Sphingomonas]KQX17857.1 oxidoreductase [Sphingomonas sp. Root1294]KQY70783.1 oxidoreductase [Sphingomonas sp. Root50]KRB91724.1 oxidoreductase [Sphingomonas sp. Root720]
MAEKFAIVTGASSGIGLELARIAAREGYDLLIVADETYVAAAADQLRREGATVEAVEADLSTLEGVDRLLGAAGARKVDLLCANAGHGLGRDFLGQEVAEWRHVIDTNVTGTLYLLQKVLVAMAARDDGKVLITGSIAGYMPGSFQAVYNGTKAFIDSFADALRNELKEKKGITITTLMPGPTETEFFERADMMDTKVGTQEKDDAAKVAQDGWDALMKGEGHIVSGWKNKVQKTIASVTPAATLAEMHRKMAEPGTAER